MTSSSFDLISKTDLDAWIAHPDFASYLPTWVESLIRAEAGDSLISCDFASAEDAAKQGYDGTTTTKTASENVPEGEAIWELGKGSGVRAKAKEEYERIRKMLGKTASSHTFVFVSPRPFPQRRKETHLPFNEVTRQDWVRARKLEGHFKDVIVLDQALLRKWSSKHIAVGLHLINRFGGARPTEQVELPSNDLKRYMSRFGMDEIDATVLLCGREDLAARIQVFEEVTAPLPVIANSVDEAMAVTVSALMAIEDETIRARMLESTLVCRSSSVLTHMQKRTGLTYIVSAELEHDLHLIQPGNRVFLCKPLDNRTIDEETVARDPGVDALRDYLRDKGIKDGDKLAAMSGGAIASLQRLTGTYSGPSYADTRGEEKQIILFASLFGGWSEAPLVTREKSYTSLDAELIEAAIGSFASFSTFKTHLAAHIDRGEENTAVDTLLKKVGDMYWVKAPIDAIDCLLFEFDDHHFDAFETALISAFSGENEIVIEPAGAFAQRRTYSRALKTGLALNFCILAYRAAERRKRIKGQSTERWVSDVFERLMKKVDFIEFIRAEDGLLRYFAEASPEVFLEALEAHLQGQLPGISPALSVEDDEWSIFQRNNAAPLMWALMRLAWMPEHFERVVHALIVLHELDPDKNANYAPRPATVFRGLFVAFAPQTSLTWRARMEALEALPNEKDQTLFDLLYDALPRSHMSQSVHSTPIFGPQHSPDMTHEDLFAARDALFRKSLRLARGHASRAAKMVSTLDRMSEPVFEEAFSQLKSDAQAFSFEERAELWKPLRRLIVRHTRVPDADWVMQSARLEHLQEWLNVLEPMLSAQAEYLFSASWIDDYTTQDLSRSDALEQRRASILRNILDEDGTHGITDLATKVNEPGHLGIALANAAESLEELFQFLDFRHDGIELPPLFFRGVSQRAYSRFGEDWLVWIFSQDRKGPLRDRCLEMLHVLPIENAITARVSQIEQDVEFQDAYWTKVSIYFDPKESVSVDDLQKLLSYNRHAEVLTQLRFLLDDQPNEVLRALLEGVYDSLNHGTRDVAQGFDVSALMKLLSLCRERNIFSLEQMAGYEFPLASQFRWTEHAYPYAIHQLATERADYFIELLSFMYVASKPFSENEREISESARKNRANLTYHVFDTMRYPGLQTDMVPEEGALFDWIESVQELAVEHGLLEAANQTIGEVLAGSSKDSDDQIWPRREVRDALEAFADERMLSGFSTKEFNSRGTYSNGYPFYSRSAEKFEGFAKQLDAWPKTRALLKKIAASDRRHAEEDRTRSQQRDAMPKLY